MSQCTKKTPHKDLPSMPFTAQEQLIYYAQKAPSAHNTKPWVFTITDNQIDLLIDFSKRLPVADPDNRELYISIGCALTNLVVAAQSLGFDTHVSYPLCDDKSVTVMLTQSPSPYPHPLFNAIIHRLTNRSRYSSKALSPDIITQLHTCCVGSTQLILARNTLKDQIAQFVYDGDCLQYADRAYTNELAYWIKQGLIYSGFMRSCVSFAVQHLPLGRFIAAQDKQLIISSPLFGILCAPNTPLSWIQLGQTYELITLTATANGLKTHPMNQGLTEVAQQREQLKKLLNSAHEPLFCFRIGY